MPDNDHRDKTQPASNRRRREARQQGQVWHSGELSAALMLAGVALLLSWQGSSLVTVCGNWLRQSLASAPIVRSDQLGHLVNTPSLTAIAGTAAQLLIGLWLIALIARFVLVGPLIVPQLVQPQIERISLTSGWRRMVSADMLLRGPFWILKLLVIGGIVWWTVTREAGALAGCMQLEPVALAVSLGAFVLAFVWRMCGGLLVVAAIDAGWQWWSHERRLRMSLDELRAERRESNRTPIRRSATVARLSES